MKFSNLFILFFFAVSSYTNANTQLPVDSVLNDIKNRGHLRCGVNKGGILGFAEQDTQGRWSGFDVEFCRAIAAAVFNDPEKIVFVPLSGTERFTRLSQKEVDVLYRNSTSTAVRDITLGIRFAGTNYYDGQGFIVVNSLGVRSAYKIQNARICSVLGTTSINNLRAFISANNLNSNLIVEVVNEQEMIQSLQNSRCDAASSDQSTLYSIRASLNNADNFTILPEIISKEPLGPAIAQGDNNWFSIVRWTLNAMIEAEFLGINSNNIEALRESLNESSSRTRLIGTNGNLGQTLGLENDWAYNVIKTVGNYGEVFERTIGSESQLNIARGLNAQWNNGGILYSDPF